MAYLIFCFIHYQLRFNVIFYENVHRNLMNNPFNPVHGLLKEQRMAVMEAEVVKAVEAVEAIQEEVVAEVAE